MTTQIDFTENFYTLTVLQQKIWTALQWYHQKFQTVFVSHQKIAQRVGCHRETVIKAIKEFVNRGWMHVKKRIRQTSIYYMNKALIFFKIRPEKSFRESLGSPRENRLKPDSSIDNNNIDMSSLNKSENEVAQILVNHPDFKPKKSVEQAYNYYRTHPDQALSFLNTLIERNSATKCTHLPQAIFETLTNMAPRLCMYSTYDNTHFIFNTPGGAFKTLKNGIGWHGWLEKALNAHGIVDSAKIISAVEVKLQQL